MADIADDIVVRVRGERQDRNEAERKPAPALQDMS